jgi:hypothetical protein
MQRNVVTCIPIFWRGSDSLVRNVCHDIVTCSVPKWIPVSGWLYITTLNESPKCPESWVQPRRAHLPSLFRAPQQNKQLHAPMALPLNVSYSYDLMLETPINTCQTNASHEKRSRFGFQLPKLSFGFQSNTWETVVLIPLHCASKSQNLALSFDFSPSTCHLAMSYIADSGMG